MNWISCLPNGRACHLGSLVFDLVLIIHKNHNRLMAPGKLVINPLECCNNNAVIRLGQMGRRTIHAHFASTRWAFNCISAKQVVVVIVMV